MPEMTIAEWEAMIALHDAEQSQLQRSMDERSPPTREPEPVLNAGQRQVRASYEQQRPVLDPATMALWDAYVDERIKAIVDPALEMVADAIGEIAGEIDGRIDKHIQIYNANEKMIDKNIETIDEDIKNLVALRDQLRKEFKDELVTLRKEFAAKNTKLRRDLQSDTRNVTNLPAIIRSRDER